MAWWRMFAAPTAGSRTVYVAIGVYGATGNCWAVAETEGAKFWLSCLTDLKNRGLHDIFVACIDGLSGFAEAIHAAYPRTSVQLCIVHLVRAALRYVSNQDSKAVARDLKKIYASATVIEAEQALEEFAQAGREVSDDQQDVACEVAGHRHALRLPAGDPPGDLHDQRDRIDQQRDPQVHA
jgi:transposase-like protein